MRKTLIKELKMWGIICTHANNIMMLCHDQYCTRARKSYGYNVPDACSCEKAHFVSSTSEQSALEQWHLFSSSEPLSTQKNNQQSWDLYIWTKSPKCSTFQAKSNVLLKNIRKVFKRNKIIT